jgi:hypothetical protein
MTDRTEGLDAGRLTARLDLELRLIADAVELVAHGSSPRVTIAGIRFGDELLERARAMAALAGLRASGLYRTDESGSDLVIERVAEERAP